MLDMNIFVKKCLNLGRLEEVEYSRKFLITAAVCVSYTVLGWNMSQYGTALPDIMFLIGVNLKMASWLLAMRCFGFIAGSLLWGIVFDKRNRFCVMFVASSGTALCALLTTYVLSFWAAAALRFCTGAFFAGIDTGANVILPSIWKKEVGPYLQAMYVFYAVGGILVPFATEPFMLPEGYRINKTSVCILCNFSKENASNTTVFQDDQIIRKTKIHIAFLITTIVSLFACLLYILMYCRKKFRGMGNPNVDFKANTDANIDHDFVDTEMDIGCVQRNRQTSEKVDESKPVSRRQTRHENEGTVNTGIILSKTENDNTSTASLRLVLVVLFLVSLATLLYTAAEDTFSAYLMTYSIDYLLWDKGNSAKLISIYWVFSCLGGIAGAFLIRVFKSTKLLFISYFFWLLSFSALLVASIFRNGVLLWVSVSTAGFFMVQIVPAIFTWIEEKVCPVTGRIVSVVSMFCGIGGAVTALTTGYMMENLSYLYFLYILIAEAVLSLTLYTLAWFFGKNIGQCTISN